MSKLTCRYDNLTPADRATALRMVEVLGELAAIHNAAEGGVFVTRPTLDHYVFYVVEPDYDANLTTGYDYNRWDDQRYKDGDLCQDPRFLAFVRGWEAKAAELLAHAQKD